jgi:N-acetylglucosaminyl-diphospho-decaprenol L-rhamnosyltransferase
MSRVIELDHPIPLLVTIVNYQTPQLTIACLSSLATEIQSLPGTHVVVVDNASGDRSVEQIEEAIRREGWNHWVSLMVSEINGGFAWGNNLAIRPALTSPHHPTYFLLLNPDTIVNPGAIKLLVDFMDRHPHIGIAGSRLEDPDGTPQVSAFRFPSWLSELDAGLRLGIVSKLLSKWIVAPPVSDIACQTDWVAGASMVVRREVFEQADLMDEGYFMYFEELDFCLQAKKLGWDCWYVPESRVVHLVGQSSGITNTAIPNRLPSYWFDSRRRYFLKNYGWFYAILTDSLWLLGFVLWRGRMILQCRQAQFTPYLLRDFFFNSSLVKIKY